MNSSSRVTNDRSSLDVGPVPHAITDAGPMRWRGMFGCQRCGGVYYAFAEQQGSGLCGPCFIEAHPDAVKRYRELADGVGRAPRPPVIDGEGSREGHQPQAAEGEQA